MRTLRLSLAGTVILALLGGMPALAQDPEKATWTHVTGQTNMDDEWVEIGPLADSRWDGSVEYYDAGAGSYLMPVEWSDPRLPETMHVREGLVLHHGDVASWDDSMWVYARAVRLDAPNGAWVGSARGVAGSDGTLMLYELTGGGAYESLSALFGQDNSQYPVVRFDGWIFEGEMPPMPDPLEPYTVEQSHRAASADCVMAATTRPNPLFMAILLRRPRPRWCRSHATGQRRYHGCSRRSDGQRGLVRPRRYYEGQGGPACARSSPRPSPCSRPACRQARRPGSWPRTSKRPVRARRPDRLRVQQLRTLTQRRPAIE